MSIFKIISFFLSGFFDKNFTEHGGRFKSGFDNVNENVTSEDFEALLKQVWEFAEEQFRKHYQKSTEA